MKRWTPDFCPSNPPCVIELGADWTAPRGFARMCSHHQAMRDGGMRDVEVFRSIVQTSRVKEVARYRIKTELALSKEVSIPYRVEPDGRIVIESGERGARLTELRGKVAAALALIERPTGTSAVEVE